MGFIQPTKVSKEKRTEKSDAPRSSLVPFTPPKIDLDFMGPVVERPVGWLHYTTKSRESSGSVERLRSARIIAGSKWEEKREMPKSKGFRLPRSKRPNSEAIPNYWKKRARAQSTETLMNEI